MIIFGRLYRAFALFLFIISSSFLGASFAFAQVATTTAATSTSATTSTATSTSTSATTTSSTATTTSATTTTTAPTSYTLTAGATTSVTTAASTPATGVGVIPANTDPHNTDSVTAAVASYFANVPLMAAIAHCESGDRQYDSNGLPLFNPTDTVVGVFQESVAHMPAALSMGWDITTLPGNLAYANYLYQQDGIDPWLDSYGCWGSTTAAQTQAVTSTVSTPTTISVMTATSSTLMTAVTTAAVTAPLAQPIPGYGVVLVLGMSSPLVQQVQQMLNAAGYTLASSGPGSPGQETSLFGDLTRAAVRSFQCAKGIACSGDESTNGYGAVDARTYAALTAAQPATPVSSTPTPPTPAPTPTGSTSSATSNADQISQVEAQIVNLTNQLQALDQQLNQLTK